MALSTTKEQDWDIVIEPKAAWLNLNVGELWRYRDLIRLMVWRDVVAVYKQTVLGLLWHVIQPLTTTFTFALIFGKAAGLAPPGVPSGLFYLTGVVPWMYFSSVVTKTSKTFLGGQNIMTKVYFPRLVIPISTATSQLVSFGIQLVTLLVIFTFYTVFRGFHWEVNLNILILPYLILLMALLGLAMGIIVSAMTTKYRDLSFLVGFGVQLLMYASPVIFPLSSSFFNDLPALKTVFELNPMTSIIESMRVIFLGGELNFGGLAYTTVFTVIFSVIGLGLFNRVERMFADII